MTVLSESTTLMRSRMTRYGLSGVSSDVSFGCHDASQSDLSAAISAEGSSQPGVTPASSRSAAAWCMAPRTSAASPRTMCSTP